MNNKEIMAYDEARYVDVAGYGASTTNIQLMNVGFNRFDESSNPTEKSTQYIGDKSKTNVVTGYDNQFAIESDRIKNDLVNDYCYDVFINRKTGSDAQTYMYIVDLSEETATNTYNARKIRVSTVIESCTNNPGEAKVFSGAFKGIGDFTYGTFNTSTKTFTETA
jgi:hypothetical protein